MSELERSWAGHRWPTGELHEIDDKSLIPQISFSEVQRLLFEVEKLLPERSA